MGVGSFVTFFSDDDCINPVVVGYWEMAQSNKDGSILVHFLTYQRSFFTATLLQQITTNF